MPPPTHKQARTLVSIDNTARARVTAGQYHVLVYFSVPLSLNCPLPIFSIMLDRPRLTRISKQLSNIALARLEARLSLFGLLEAVAVSSICWICIKDSGADFGAPELYSLPLPRKAYILPTSDMQRTPGALSSPFAIVPCAYIHPPQWSGSIECAITMLPPAHSKPTSSPLSTICCCPQYVHPIKAEMMPLEIRAQVGRLQ